MSGRRVFLFDECLGKLTMRHLRTLVDTTAEFRHLCDEFRQGVPDAEWAPKAAATGCVVITSDGGRQSKRSMKLPEMLSAVGVTQVVLSPKLHEKPMAEKAAARAAVWPLLEEATLEAGARFVPKQHPQHGRLVTRLERKRSNKGGRRQEGK